MNNASDRLRRNRSSLVNTEWRWTKVIKGYWLTFKRFKNRSRSRKPHGKQEQTIYLLQSISWNPSCSRPFEDYAICPRTERQARNSTWRFTWRANTSLVTGPQWHLVGQPANMSFEVFAFILGIIISIALIFFAIWNVSTRTCPSLGVFLLPTQFLVSPFLCR